MGLDCDLSLELQRHSQRSKLMSIARKYRWLILIVFACVAAALAILTHRSEILAQPPAQLDAATSVERANDGLAVAIHGK